MSTIKDVAKKAGVSIATVSRVINGLGGVRPRTEKKILEAIEELNYSPNAVARSMVKKETKTIGVVVPDIANPFFPEVIKGIEVRAREYGFTTFLANSNESIYEEDTIIQALRERRIDGLIITTANELDSPIIKHDIDIPVVMLDRYVENTPYDGVVIDNVKGAFLAVKHLVTEGHTKIGIIAGPSNVTPGRDRTRGFKKALFELQVPFFEEYYREGDFKERSGYLLGKELLSLPDPPTAIFASNNLMTIGLLKYVRDSKLILDKDITIVGFDDLDIGNFIENPITVVSRPMRQMGETAAELLIERIQGKHFDKPRKIIFVPKLVIKSN